jgi:hypothetical protein
MRVIIAGSRGLADKQAVVDAIAESAYEISQVVCGGARGADRLGAEWASENNIPVAYFDANWELYGKSAGHKRNYEMAHHADALILVWNGHTPGSKSMLRIAKDLGLPFFEKKVLIT